MGDVRGFSNGWLISHIKGVVVSWAIVSVVTAVSYRLYGDAYGTSGSSISDTQMQLAGCPASQLY
jgi:hypothetical protein